jgi:hypothetical protein
MACGVAVMSEQRTYASKAAPCVVCRGKDGCCRTPDGLILCRRTSGNVPGFRWLSKHKPAGEWHLYRQEGNPRPPTSSSFVLRKGAGSPPTAHWPAYAMQCVAALTPERAAQLADHLGLPTRALAALPLIGWDEGRGAWVFPEADASGKVVGAFFRSANGFRGVMAGSKRGLYLPDGWRDRPGPVRVAEGASDVLALCLLGLPCVGRPSAMVGADLLAEVLRPVIRDVVVLGDNDLKPNGLWPGRDGAEHIATKLRAALPGRKIEVRFPPSGFKDARDWVIRKLAG